MKKLIVLGIAVGLVVVGLRWMGERYEAIDADVNKGGGFKAAEKQGVVVSDPAEEKKPQNPAPPAPAPQPVISSSCVAPTGKPSEVVCTKDLDAFNPLRPVEKGKFLKGSRLIIGEKDAATGMMAVTYTEANGKIVRALCRSQDLGK